MTSSHTPEIAHHGDVTLSVDVHDGLIEYVLVIDRTQLVDGARLRISDQQARDAGHCFADLFPYSYVHPPKTAPTEGPRRCQYCGHKVAQIFDVGGAWCGIECRAYDRGNEETFWRKAVQR